jgi:Ni/Co efflux regulator RcnB
MILKTLVSTLTVFCLGASGLSFAQDGGDRRDRGDNMPMQRGGPPDRPGGDMRRGDGPPGRSDSGAQRDERGAGPNHAFRRGQRLPSEYRNNRYVVNDWRGRNLSAPPRGYHWVQTGGDYVLVAIATGVILQLMLNN